MAKLIFPEEMIRLFSSASMVLKSSGFWLAGGALGAAVQTPCSAHLFGLPVFFDMWSLQKQPSVTQIGENQPAIFRYSRVLSCYATPPRLRSGQAVRLVTQLLAQNDTGMVEEGGALEACAASPRML